MAFAETSPVALTHQTEEIFRHVRALAPMHSKPGPGTAGEDKTIAYLVAELRNSPQTGNPTAPTSRTSGSPLHRHAQDAFHRGNHRMELTPSPTLSPQSPA